jgi:hypothetical protein
MTRNQRSIPVIPTTGEVETGGLQFKADSDKNTKPYQKKKPLRAKRIGDMVQIVEHSPREYKGDL